MGSCKSAGERKDFNPVLKVLDMLLRGISVFLSRDTGRDLLGKERHRGGQVPGMRCPLRL